jgi:hypothetical protein
VDELAITDVNANMAEGAAHGVEEHQVTGVEFTAVNFVSNSSLLFGSPGQQAANGCFINVPHETTAIKTGFNSRTTTLVGNAQQTHCLAEHLIGFFTEAVLHLIAELHQTAHFRRALQSSGLILFRRSMRQGCCNEQTDGNGEKLQFHYIKKLTIN